MARERILPRVHTVVVAREGGLSALELKPDPLNARILCDSGTDFHVVKASTATEALELLRVNAESRWGRIVRSLPAGAGFHRTEWLMEEVRAWCRRTSTGYLVLLGDAGVGKTTFLAELIRHERQAGRVPVYHFIDYHSSATGSARWWPPVSATGCDGI